MAVIVTEDWNTWLRTLGSRWDETGRFHLKLQSDGNLVLKAYARRPYPQAIITAQTGTRHDGDIVLGLTSGILFLGKLFDPIWEGPNIPGAKDSLIAAKVLESLGRHPTWHPYGKAPAKDSTLHLQPDGNLVLYRPDGVVTWSMGTLLQELEGRQDVNKVCNPNALSLPIQHGEIASGMADTVVYNDSELPLEVYTDSQRPVQVRPGAFIGIKQTGQALPSGALDLPMAIPGEGDASPIVIQEPNKVFTPGTVVRLKQSHESFFWT